MSDVKKAAEKHILDGGFWNEGMDGYVFDVYEKLFLAGAAWQREQDAKLCETHGVIAQGWQSARSCAQIIRAQYANQDTKA